LQSIDTRKLPPERCFGDLVEILIQIGIPIYRASTSVRTMHPEVFVLNMVWDRGQGVSVFQRPHDILDKAFFTDSPIVQIQKGRPEIRVPLAGNPEDLPYPVCRDLAGQGCTDYLIQGLPLASGVSTFASWATDHPGGFDEGALATLRELVPALATRLELASAHYATASLLKTYLGAGAAQRVLNGSFRRGGGEAIESVIWMCDLRGFTAMVDGQPLDQVLTSLNAYFEQVSQAIGDKRGEVLKFIGDAIPAVFPLSAPDACRRAIAAARAAFAGMASNNEARDEPLVFGLALHVGEVMYGNIGSRDRLDFTVIGPAVNEVSRVEALCKTLDMPLLLTEAFVETLGEDEQIVSLGRHSLRGVAEPTTLFSLAQGSGDGSHTPAN